MEVSQPEVKRPAILILDMSYTLRMFRERHLEQALTSRTVDGYFGSVISVHPLAALFDSGVERFGPPRLTRLDDTHVFVEGRVGVAGWLNVLPPLNFLLAQASLVRQLLRMAREGGVSVVRVGDPYYLGLLGWLLARLLDVPLAVRVPFRYDEIRRITGRAVMPRLLRFIWLEKRIERFVFPRCDLIAGANEDNMRYAIENGGRSEVATVFRYGNLIHPRHWEDPSERPDAQRDLEEIGLAGKRFVITVSRLESVKRVEDAVRVVAQLVKRGIDVYGLVVGDGAQKEHLNTLARSSGIADRIVLAGNRPQEWLARVLPRAAVIVSPHMGRALVEAALAAVPIVAYDYDWQREVVVDDETGYLVANGDCEAMTERAERLLSDSSAAKAMGARARSKVAVMMDPDALVRHEEATYANLLAAWVARRVSSHA